MLFTGAAGIILFDDFLPNKTFPCISQNKGPTLLMCVEISKGSVDVVIVMTDLNIISRPARSVDAAKNLDGVFVLPLLPLSPVASSVALA